MVTDETARVAAHHAAAKVGAVTEGPRTPVRCTPSLTNSATIWLIVTGGGPPQSKGNGGFWSAAPIALSPSQTVTSSRAESLSVSLRNAVSSTVAAIGS